MTRGELSRRPIHVLMVDDDESEVEITRYAMNKAGITVRFSSRSSGASAMELLRATPPGDDRPDLILLDLNMPGMNGFDVLRELKGDDDLATIPVIVLTTSDDQRDVLECYRLHANSYVTKPSDLEDYDELMVQIEGFWMRLASLPP